MKLSAQTEGQINHASPMHAHEHEKHPPAHLSRVDLQAQVVEHAGVHARRVPEDHVIQLQAPLEGGGDVGAGRGAGGLPMNQLNHLVGRPHSR